MLKAGYSMWMPSRPLTLQQQLLRLRAMSMLAIAVMAMASFPAVAQLAPSKADGCAVAYSSRGQFAVDVGDIVWHDAARHRDLPVRILFPRIVMGALIDASKSASKGESMDDSGPETRYPIIVFSHGLGGSREGGALWGQHWASHGYIVIHLQHPGSDESIWKGKRPNEGMADLQGAMSLDNSRLRTGDVAFALDEMARLQAAGVAPFSSANFSRVGMSGHSFGAQTTLTVAGQRLPLQNATGATDVRIAAAIAFSPNARVKTGLDTQFAGVTMPVLFITGTRDGSILGDATRYEDRLLPYEKVPPGNKYLLSFLNGDHMVFGGRALGVRRAETARDRAIQSGVKAVTLAFWNATLKQEGAAKIWLQNEFKSMLVDGDTFAHK